jgi:hypothetical protein
VTEEGSRGSERTIELYDFHWIVFLLHSKNLKATRDRFLILGISVDFDAKVVALVMPIQGALV